MEIIFIMLELTVVVCKSKVLLTTLEILTSKTANVYK